MTATDELYRSLRSAFGGDADPLGAAFVLMVVVVIAGAATLAWVRARRAAGQALRAQVRRLAQARGLGEAEIALAIALCEGGPAPSLDVLTKLADFERATARELARHAGSPHEVREASAAQIAKLRAGLGFDVLPPDHWLATTRELKPGDVLRLGLSRLEVSEVSESSLTVVFTSAQPKVPGAGEVSLEVIRTHDARYAIHCRVRDSYKQDGRHRLVLAHDEAPERLQQRAFVRVRLARPLTLRSVDPTRADAEPVLAKLIDISAGGLSFETPVPLAQGTQHLCSFELGAGAAFNDVAAVVLGGTSQATSNGHTRAAFTGLSTIEQDQLAAAVARCQQQEVAARFDAR